MVYCEQKRISGTPSGVRSVSVLSAFAVTQQMAYRQSVSVRITLLISTRESHAEILQLLKQTLCESDVSWRDFEHYEKSAFQSIKWIEVMFSWIFFIETLNVTKISIMQSKSNQTNSTSKKPKFIHSNWFVFFGVRKILDEHNLNSLCARNTFFESPFSCQNVVEDQIFDVRNRKWPA